MARNLEMEELVRIKLPDFNANQWRFVNSTVPFCCYNGGFGSGKTTALVWKIITLCVDTPTIFGNLSGNVGLTGRYSITDFEKTTLLELLKWLPKQWIRKHFIKDGKIELWNESVIMYTHFDDVEHIKSLGINIGFAAIDQMEQIKLEVFNALAYERIRLTTLNRFNYTKDGKVPVDPPAVLNYQMVFGTSNPKRGWVHDKFAKNEELRTSKDSEIQKLYNSDYKLINSSTYENEKNLPPQYIERQKRDKSKREFARSVLGTWDAFEGQIYEDFTDDLINEKNIVPAPWWNIYVGVDHGGTGSPGSNYANNITYVAFGAEENITGKPSRVLVYDELFLPSSTIEETVSAIDEKLKVHKTAQLMYYNNYFQQFADKKETPHPTISAWRCDPTMNRNRSDADESILECYMRFASMHGFNMPLSNGDSKIAVGIQKVSWMLRKKLLRVNPRCKWWIETHKSYEYGLNEKPAEKQNDHPCDATRFMLSALPVWYATFDMPEVEESMIQKDMRMNIKREEQYDPIYGRMYEYSGI